MVPTTPADEPASDRSPLRAELEAHGVPLANLTVLAKQHDPFRLDTPASHRDGRWLAEQIADLGWTGRTVHLRGFHYALAEGGRRLRPDGSHYTNDDDTSWLWLMGSAAKSARWLGYVPWDAVVDRKNAPPVIIEHPPAKAESVILAGRLRVDLPEDLSEPTVWLDAQQRQPFRVGMYGEKSSLEPVLGPLADHYRCDLYLPAGEPTDSMLHRMASNAAADGRPFVLLSFADCDPSGWQMPISIARKLQAFKSSLFPDLSFKVHRCALTPEQVREYGLPSSPLKPTEKRADRWKAAHGVAQTEVDSLASLRPHVLRDLAEEALRPFYDESLDRRVRLAVHEWRATADARLRDLIGEDRLADHRERSRSLLAELGERIDALNREMDVDPRDFDLPPFTLPEAVVPHPPDVPPLIDSSWSFPAQCRALIASKSYGEAIA